MTLNLGSYFATLLGLLLTMLILGGSTDTQLGKSLCNFAGITSDNVDPWEIGVSIDTQLWKSLCNFGGITSDNVDPGGVRSILNLGGHFATLLRLPLTMRICGGILGGQFNTQLGRSLCNFAGITSDNVDCGWGSINTQLGRSLCNFAGIISDNGDPEGSLDTELGSHFATLVGLLLTMLIQGG